MFFSTIKTFLFIATCSILTLGFSQTKNHTVQSGETLYQLSQKYNVSVDDLKEWNKLTSNSLSVGQRLIVAKTEEHSNQEHIVGKGETLYSISKKYNVTIEQIKGWNNLEGNGLALGQTLVINPEVKPQPDQKIHTVKAGETLYSISKDYGMTIEELIRINKLQSNSLSIGQQLFITQVENIETEVKEEVKKQNADLETQAKRDIKHTVQPKETLFSISRLYNVPVKEIKELNQLDTYELSVGQLLVIQESKGSKAKKEQTVKSSKLTQESGIASLNMSSKINHSKFTYCMHKNLEVGSIVKVTNTDSDEFVYARVMGKLDKNDEAVLGINNVIVKKLGNGVTKFPVSLEYLK